ncbi:SH3 domain-containing protein [Aliigemmobacter aestuarii]|uniref:SH3 domain-containing protein n=1 Tax=Aliigemmobacter aestuarii TaxID=1445661 RepID=A0A4S3MP67_9RHOB|nr:SH3 domain-containing protein [Gemmobacter aestuarii]THD84270.1 SH3 domain-containing protein [Gemmobacter aestuarii]
MRASALLAGLAALLSGAVLPATAQDAGPDLWEVRGLSTTLNLRVAPSIGAEVLMRFVPGERLAGLGCRAVEGREWCEVEAADGGPRGFVLRDFLRAVPDDAPGAAAALAGEAGPATTGEGQGGFDATGLLACAAPAGLPLGDCAFAVIRGQGGEALLSVTLPDGGLRLIRFADGMAVQADGEAAAAPGAFRAVRQGDLHRIFVGDERFEISHGALFGG